MDLVTHSAVQADIFDHILAMVPEFGLQVYQRPSGADLVGIGVAMPGSAALGWLFRYVYQPLEATLGALLAFFAVSAAYRAFRVQSVEAGILLVSTLLALVVQLPVVGTLVPYLAELRVWLFAVPVTAGVRGILLGVALGTIVTSLRVLLAVDYPYAAD